MALKQTRMAEATQKLIQPFLERDGTTTDVMPVREIHHETLESIETFGVAFLHLWPHRDKALDGKNLLCRARLLQSSRRRMLVLEIDPRCTVRAKDLVYVKAVHYTNGLVIGYVDQREGNVIHVVCVRLKRVTQRQRKKKLYEYQKKTHVYQRSIARHSLVITPPKKHKKL